MKAYFEILFQLNVFHRFYPPEDEFRCKTLHFEPTTATFGKLKEYGLFFKDTSNGFMILAHKTLTGGTEVNPALTPLIDIPADTFFNFFIYADRPDFLNITDTDLGIYSEKRKFFFRNEAGDPMVTAPVMRNPGVDNPWLSVNSIVTTVTVHNLAPLTRVLKLANIRFDAPVNILLNPVRLVLRDIAGNPVAEKLVPRSFQNAILAEKMLLSPSPLEENIYILQQVDGGGAVLGEERYFLTPQNGNQETAGLFQVNFSNALKGTGATEYQFEIDIDTRSVQWSYNIQVDENPNPLDNYNTADLHLNNVAENVPSLGTVFTKAVNPGPPVMVSFNSNTLVPLQEMAYRDVNLIYLPLPDPIINDLPNPNPFRLKEAGVGSFKSEIYLKIK